MSTVLYSSPRFERFKLIERLGAGGAAEAWRARREGGLLEQEVCVKRPLGVLGAGARRALLEEARVLSRIRHANVVSLLDVVEEDGGSVLIVMELVDGADLRRIDRTLAAQGERLAPGSVAAVGAALCRALGAAQRALCGGLVHRDVSPHNVLVSMQGEVKLADFGVARALDRDRWTRTGVVKGKRAYLSPEQIRGEPFDVRSDLFATGIVLYELLAGRRPFESRASRSVLRAIAEGERAPLAALAPGAPRALVDAVERLLAPSPEDRPPSPDAAARLLASFSDPDAAAAELRRAVLRATRPGPARAVARPAPALAVADVERGPGV